MNKQSLAYRGTIQGIVSAGSQAAFITTHEEGQATALYRLDASHEKNKANDSSFAMWCNCYC